MSDTNDNPHGSHGFTVGVMIQSDTDLLLTIQGEPGTPAVVSLGMNEESARSIADVLLQGAEHLKRLKEAPSGALN